MDSRTAAIAISLVFLPGILRQLTLTRAQGSGRRRIGGPPLVPDRESCSVGWRRTRSDTGGIREYRASIGAARSCSAAGCWQGWRSSRVRMRRRPNTRRLQALDEQVKAGKLPAVRPATSGAASSSSRPVGQYGGVWRRAFAMPTTTCAWCWSFSLFRFSPGRRDRSESRLEPNPRRLQDLDHHTAQGRQMVRWRAVHRR